MYTTISQLKSFLKNYKNQKPLFLCSFCPFLRLVSHLMSETFNRFVLFDNNNDANVHPTLFLKIFGVFRTHTWCLFYLFFVFLFVGLFMKSKAIQKYHSIVSGTNISQIIIWYCILITLKKLIINIVFKKEIK